MTRLERYYKSVLELRDILDELKDIVNEFSINCVDLDMVSRNRIIDYVDNNINLIEFDNFTDDAFDYVKDTFELDDLYDADDILDWVKENYCVGDLVDVDLSWS